MKSLNAIIGDTFNEGRTEAAFNVYERENKRWTIEKQDWRRLFP